MTMYETMKKATLEEMASFLYSVAEPFLDNLDFTKEEKRDVYKQYLEALKTEL